MNLLNQLVQKLLEEHTGGEPFFDALDESVKNKDIFETLFNQIQRDFPDGVSFIFSGRFGRYAINCVSKKGTYLSNGICHTLLVGGGLRSGVPIDDLSLFQSLINNNAYVFIDDSFYKGRTRDVIKTELERLGGHLVKTYVVYDGSKEEDSDVFSLYRYWDHQDD